MTTLFPFQPPTAPVIFQPTLDGDLYQATITWNYYSQRFYITITDLVGNTIVSRAIVGSSSKQPLADLSWQNGLATAVVQNPHGYPIGGLIELTISDAIPSGYNGIFECSILDDLTFTYPVAGSPWPALTSASGVEVAQATGTYSFDINLVEGYFQTSTLVYRGPLAQFEVAP